MFLESSNLRIYISFHQIVSFVYFSRGVLQDWDQKIIQNANIADYLETPKKTEWKSYGKIGEKYVVIQKINFWHV